MIAVGRAALACGAWDRAREAFAQALAVAPSIDAYEGLGVASRYLLDRDAAFAAHETGFRMARARHDDDAAAWMAVQLCYDAYAFRGPSEAGGWVERAKMLVAGRPPSPASAFVPFARGYLALLAHHDPDTAAEVASQAVALARQVGAIDIELLALSLEGLALVALGRVGDGMRKLDAAAAGAVGGEMTDVDSIETVCCLLIDACKRVRDLERANEWCLRVREIATRFGDRQMFNVCRIHYADVLIWQGELDAAEGELQIAADELGRIRPGREVDALVRLAEIHRRRGDTAGAGQLLDRSEQHRMHALLAGQMALDRGAVDQAIEASERFLRRIGTADLFERVTGLELAVRAHIAGGDPERAVPLVDEITLTANRTSSTPLRAAAQLAAGRLAVARGAENRAIPHLEDAADLYLAAGARWDAAQALSELATAHRVAGRIDAATRAEGRAHQELTAMGIVRTPVTETGVLSRRETEVLRMLARGMSNDDIAARLVLSVRTVERHVANVYGKIGASGRTARAVATAWAHTRGIT